MSESSPTEAKAKTNPPLIFEEVSYAYGEDFEQPALEGIDLTVAAGEFIALVGANGSGKSTLSKMVNALIIPNSGKVYTLGLDTSTENEDLIFDIRSEAGLVLQNPDSQIVASIVSDDVAFGPENLLVPHAEIVERVDEALDDVKMTEYALADPSYLSGGQKQRVCIAGLLAMRPQVLVLDEPGAMLDIRGRRGVRRVLKELHASGLTVVLVTHFMEEAALAERVVVLSEGKVLLQGPPRDVFAHGAQLRELGLDVPFSVQLAFALRKHGFELPDIASPRELKEVLVAALAKHEQSRQRSEIAAESADEDSPSDPESHTSHPKPHSSHPESHASLPESRLCHPERSEGSPVSASTGEATEGEEDVHARQVPVVPSIESHLIRRAQVHDPVVDLDEVAFFYPTSNTGDTEKPALNNISLCLARGELMGIVGHTGSGKTTLLRIIAGLLPATDGSVHVAGVDLSRSRKRPALHAKVGMVFQYPERQLFAPTVAEDVAFGLVNAGFEKEAIEVKVRTALKQVGLDYDNYAKRSPFELSGGEKRRIAIAGVIVMDPEVLIFDEPTAGLDVQGQLEIQALIRTLKERGKTIILTSHSLDAIAQLATTVAVLYKGELVMLGSPEQVFTKAHEPELKRMNLGLPHAAEFARELCEIGYSMPDGLFTVPALADAITNALGGDTHGA